MAINIGQQNKPNAPGRSIVDYSLIACFTLVVLLLILVLDAFEYISVPGSSRGSGKMTAASSGEGAVTSDELEEVQKQIEEAKAELAAKKKEIEKIVDRAEDEIKKEKTPAGQVETPAEKKAEEEKKADVVEAIAEKELGIDKFCGDCQYKQMNFNCNKRVSWMMETYGITEVTAKESVINSCHVRRLRGGPN
mmetsp:Transcript_14591/g.35164  ORF Transcript_14591/g.35164 Transcript_14591/m.35164 type:complete len:193 (-) Transcript_14591:310-888(-)|eukprot:CAMPEP_0181124100 /NCGR_PEP_ID=MMETSP1071-20121207/26282_1 /TAXON_ID=35127 /ORGANISM="Thalassiosira sp., Strain NH16" /LENGTH=192 /DNA_ID=CAMNT_0023209345 /DNA_START=8 /DNA_END=586 /DNA_ORIENTATION=+